MLGKIVIAKRADNDYKGNNILSIIEFISFLEGFEGKEVVNELMDYILSSTIAYTHKTSKYSWSSLDEDQLELAAYIVDCAWSVIECSEGGIDLEEVIECIDIFLETLEDE